MQFQWSHEADMLNNGLCFLTLVRRAVDAVKFFSFVVNGGGGEGGKALTWIVQ